MNLEKEDVMTQITYRKLRIDEAQLFWNMMTELDNEKLPFYLSQNKDIKEMGAIKGGEVSDQKG